MHTREKFWVTDAGYKAVVVMYHRMGHRCGYVGVPSGHSLYRKKYSEHCEQLGWFDNDVEHERIGKRGVIPIMCATFRRDRLSPDLVFNVHGSITFSHGGDWDRNFPIPNTNLWWFGYDCGHAGDGIVPEDRAMIGCAHLYRGPVRSLEYCIGECESLALQLREADGRYREVVDRKFEKEGGKE